MPSENPTLDAIYSHLSGIFASIPKPEEITELMINPDGLGYYEYRGDVVEIKKIVDMTSVSSLISMLASTYDLVCNRDHPRLAVRLPANGDRGGGRVQAIIPPITTAPSLTIRFPAKKQFSLEDLLELGSFNQVRYRDAYMPSRAVPEFLSRAVKEHRNIIVSGPTGSGKTTLANAMLNLIFGERVLVIEDTPELFIRNPNTVYMQTNAAYSTRDAVFDALRMRPDRIMVGEMRDGPTVIELLKAWMTGHPGGLTSIHADSAGLVPNRLGALMKEVVAEVDQDLLRSITLVVHVTRKEVNGRRIRFVEEIRETATLSA